MIPPIYDNIGIEYNETRRADPYIASRIATHLQPKPGGLYLDIGCGTGNYLQALQNLGLTMYGVDPSNTMLGVAEKKCPDAILVKGHAESIPYPNDFFDGATAMFTFHHWTDKQLGLNELYRVVKPGAHIVFLSFTAQQMSHYWLSHYFPVMIRESGELVPGVGGMTQMLQTAGFVEVTTENYFVSNDLQDHFLYSNKYRPEQYLDPNIRKGISSFAAFSTPAEVKQGLQELKADIGSGKIDEVIRSYENELGDYLFYMAVKK